MDKRELIFESVLNIINKKLSTDIKIADVAKQANIGKSTIYEYFKSKDELLSETILYLLDKQYNNLDNIIKDDKTFKENYFELIKKINELITENIYFIKYIFIKDNFCNFNDESKNLLKAQFENIADKFTKIITKLNNKGLEEGLLSPNTDDFDRLTAFNNSVLSIIHYQKNYTRFKHIKFEEILERSYKYYIKLLK
jgi:AcrR family transcriptional regulator